MSTTSFPTTTLAATAEGELPGQHLIDQLHGFRRDADRRRFSTLLSAEVSRFAVANPVSSIV